MNIHAYIAQAYPDYEKSDDIALEIDLTILHDEEEAEDSSADQLYKHYYEPQFATREEAKHQIHYDLLVVRERIYSTVIEKVISERETFDGLYAVLHHVRGLQAMAAQKMTYSEFIERSGLADANYTRERWNQWSAYLVSSAKWTVEQMTKLLIERAHPKTRMN